jgi:cytochrome c oxidase subunit I
VSDVALTGELVYARTEPRGLAAWFMSTDHKHIGKQYMATSLVFFLIAMVIAITMRTQTIQPGMKVLSPEAYDEAFSVHGTTMIFFFAMPMLIGFANFIVPLQIGARDMAFPRLNALSYWLYLLAGMLFYSGFLYGSVLDTGWFSYAPLTERAFSPHDGVSVWIIALTILGISSVAGAVNFIITMMKLRAAGMTWLRMPLFCQATFINSFLIIFAFPSLTAAVGMLYLDRYYHTGWLNPARGGDPIIWEHLFWFFGHPEVYILILPAFGMMSEVIQTFSHKPLFGRTSMVISLLVIGFLSFLVWAHHMFTAGLPTYFNAFMSATSMLIAIPTGVKIFNWLATMWGGALRFKTSLLFACGMIATFTVGGITGVLQASVPFDFQVNQTMFITGHLHNVLFGGTVFIGFAATYYWFPKMTGRMLSDRLGKVHFWIILVGFLMTFMPMYALGILGMPRHQYTYAATLGWGTLELISGIGAYVIGAAMVIFVVNVVRSLLVGEPAGDDPWDAWTLEWATSSPPPHGNFSTLPVVDGDLPLWSAKHPGERLTATVSDRRPPNEAPREVVALHLTPPDADHWTKLPVLTALAILVVGIGLLTTLLVSVVGIALLLILLALWMAAGWITPEAPVMPRQHFTALGGGTLLFISSETVLFGCLVAADLHLRIHGGRLALGDPSRLHTTLPWVNTAILMTSGVMAHYALSNYRRARLGWFRFFLVATVILGVAFLGGQAWEYTHAGFGLSSGLLGETFYTLTGLHGLHVTAGILVLVYLLFRSSGERRRSASAEPAAVVTRGTGTAGMVEAATYYWHFVDAVWVVIFTVVYLL